MQEEQYDILIVGAGPAGCACALALKDSGLRVAIVDKTTFPRDKVCGDAIPGRAIKTLRKIDKAFANEFEQFDHKCETRYTTLFYKQKQLTFKWVQPAYTCARVSFDNFLFELVRKHTSTAILTNTAPGSIAVAEDGIAVHTSERILKAQLIVGADGAHSAVAKQLAPRALDRKHHAGSVRAYYSDIAGLSADTTEIYFEQRFLPSYLWVFPLPGGRANVGFGMLSSEIAKRRVNIKTAFYDFIAQMPELNEKFKAAEQVSSLDGFGLPLGSNIGTLSGERFMLCGDAASLIDPISGDGIGNAMLSGRLAAEQAMRCFTKNDFSGQHMKAYDKAVLAALGKELKMRHRAQVILTRVPFLLDAVFLAGRSKWLKRIIQKAL
ncbi:MAG: geranylgeranyl reductase family protein [Bacteroidota bacterium]